MHHELRLDLMPVAFARRLLQLRRQYYIEQVREIQDHVAEARAIHPHTHLHAVWKNHAGVCLVGRIGNHPGDDIPAVVPNELVEFIHAGLGVFVPFDVCLFPNFAPLHLSSLQELGLRLILFPFHWRPLYIPRACCGLDAKVKCVNGCFSQRQ